MNSDLEKDPLQPSKHESYLVICCGYEGIEHILGAFATGEEAAEKLKEWRPFCKDLEGDCPSAEGYPVEVRLWSEEPEQLCIQYITSESPAKCCCSEYGVGPGKLWLY